MLGADGTVALMAETPAASAPIQPEPVALVDLFDLFVRPREFFAGHISLGRTPALLLVAWVVGVGNVLGGIHRELLKDSVASRHVFAVELSGRPALFFLGWIAAVGAFSGFLIYRVFGWWYRRRLLLCDVFNADPILARHVYIYATFVADAPIVLLAVIQTLRYGNYAAACANAGLADVVPIVAVLWSVTVSWKGVRAAFPMIRRRAAVIWFLVFPWAFYLVVMGHAAVLLALFSTAQQG